MSDPLNYPKLRWPIDTRIEKIENQEVLIISCPLGIAERPLLLVPAVAPIISCFDGTLSLADISARFAQYGVREELVKDICSLLDSHLFLLSPRFANAAALVREQFKNSRDRPAALAGLSYPSNERDLRLLLEGYIPAPSAQALSDSPMIALVSPHIDYRRGGAAYGSAYQRLQSQSHDLYLIIGTCHQYSTTLFQLTAKNFATPLGMLPSDSRFIEKLAARYGIDRSFADELMHRREHSLELQTPFLRHVRGEVSIVPILVGSFHKMISSSKYPNHFDEYESFLGGLVEAMKLYQAEGRSVCVVAGVDMAHVGQHFGDEQPLCDEFLGEVARRDAIYLEAINRQDKRALFDHIAEDGDKRRICGFPTMYTVIDLFDRLGVSYKSEIIDYRQAVDKRTDCCVTFAGMGIYANTQQSVQR